MELFLQFGYGMMEHCRHLISSWGGGTVVLSPRDLNDRQLRSLSSDLIKLGGKVLLDPQFYLPHADHVRLCSHNYWPESYDTGAFFQGAALTKLLEKLIDLNNEIATNEIILPGLLANELDDAWLETQRAFLQTGREMSGGKKVLGTIALNSDTTRIQDNIALLLESASDWDVDGFYIVCEHPNGDYLVGDPNWLANVLDLTAGLRLSGAKVIIGYCNHQLLSASLVRANAICSGTWMNVRSFPPSKFRTKYDDEIKQRATWYYCPAALSEYKIPFLDIAQRQNILVEMAPDDDLDGGYARRLFEGLQPTTVGISEQHAFRHYLHCLRGQVRNLEKLDYNTAFTSQNNMLSNASSMLSRLVHVGVRGQQRDFSEITDVNLSALSIVDSLRGPILKRRWQDL